MFNAAPQTRFPRLCKKLKRLLTLMVFPLKKNLEKKIFLKHFSLFGNYSYVLLLVYLYMCESDGQL